jgi:hypothetical protein
VSLYQKVRADGRADWYARLKVGGKWDGISLGLMAKANAAAKDVVNMRDARARHDELAAALRAGTIAELPWLLPDQVARLKLKMARATLDPANWRPRDWAEAAEAWMAEKAGELRPPDPKKINPGNGGHRQRGKYLQEFVRYVEGLGIALDGVDITGAFIGFYRSVGHRRGNTLNIHFDYLVVFGDWLAGRGCCVKPDRDKVRKALPPIEPPVVVVPHWTLDLEMMRALRDARHSSERARAAWSLFLCVRGLGCRPDEPTHLIPKRLEC